MIFKIEMLGYVIMIRNGLQTSDFASLCPGTLGDAWDSKLIFT